MRKIIIRDHIEAGVPAEDLFELRKASFEQWREEGLVVSEANVPMEQFRRYLRDKVVFVAHDATMGELLGMHTLKLDKRKGFATGSNLAVAPQAKHEGVASQMLQEEVRWLRQNGYRHLKGETAIPATWSVQWHLKNGYYITGYHRRDRSNYASYTFRKPLRHHTFSIVSHSSNHIFPTSYLIHHPSDLFWTRPLAPFTAKGSYLVSYVITCLCKTPDGRFNWLGRLAKKIRRGKR